MRNFEEMPYQVIQAAAKKLQEVGELCAELVAGETLAAGRLGTGGQENRLMAEVYSAMARNCIGNSERILHDLEIRRKRKEMEKTPAIERKG